MSINQKIQPGSFVLNNGHDILKKTSVDVSALSSLTQSALDDILAQLPHQGRINFSQVLEEKGYSSYMSGIRFNARWADKLHIDFSDCQFDHVKFTGKIELL